MPHRTRTVFGHRLPVHVTAHAADGIDLRAPAWLPGFESALRDLKKLEGLLVAHYSAQGNHLHLLVEADSSLALSRGLQRLLARLARTYNRGARRRGAVWADRYHAHVLRSPREVRHALRYVLDNHALHAARAGRPCEPLKDPFSSVRYLGHAHGEAPVAAPRTWLLRSAHFGWRRRGAR